MVYSSFHWTFRSHVCSVPTRFIIAKGCSSSIVMFMMLYEVTTSCDR